MTDNETSNRQTNIQTDRQTNRPTATNTSDINLADYTVVRLLSFWPSLSSWPSCIVSFWSGASILLHLFLTDICHRIGFCRNSLWHWTSTFYDIAMFTVFQ